MSILRRLRRFLASVPSRVDGSRIPVSHDGVTRLSALAPTGGTFKALKPAVYPPNPKPPVRRLIEQQPDVPVAPKPVPIDLEDLPAA